RETQLTRIAADKEVEAERREIAEVVRERVAVDRTVAEQEEAIKRLRAVEEAERERQAVVIAAEAEAQERLVKDIKAAEAAEAAAVHRAAEELTLAEARLKSADLDAQAKLRLAEGVQAEAAAEGLAAAQVRAKEAEVIEKAGRAEAEATAARMRAEAEGTRATALARAEGAEAQALADAKAIGEKLKAEAAGLTDKAAAMAALDEASRAHEEYRLRLEAEKEIRLAGLDVQRQVAEAQATVLATGLENADIDIVGGDSVFLDRLVGSIALGKGVDGFVQHSDTAQALAKPWLDGSTPFTEDLTRMLGSVTSSDVQNLTVSALLAKLMKSGATDPDQLHRLLDTAADPARLRQLPDTAAESGLAELNGTRP
ncbi:MAG TPA: flotillin family protein, partial [Streptomyces sp.]